jgi:hypothetical protein
LNAPTSIGMFDGVFAKRTCVAAAAVVAMAALAGCSPTVAQLLNPGYPRCQESLRKAFEITLIGQGETDEVAQKVAADAVQALADVELGARPFKVSSPSGVDYGYFFEREDDRCLLRLVAWQKGFVQYSNNVTFIATRPLPGCGCKQ